MLNKEHNHQHTTEYCHNCKTSEYTLYDNHLDETYCSKCGTVLIDNTLPSITQEITNTISNVKFIRDLWRKQRR